MKGSFGTDYGFVSGVAGEVKVKGVYFKGTAGSAQDRADGLVLSLGAKGEVSCRGYRLASDAAAEATIAGGKIAVSTSRDHRQGRRVILALPRGHALVSTSRSIRLQEVEKGVFHLDVPDGATNLKFEEKGTH